MGKNKNIDLMKQKSIMKLPLKLNLSKDIYVLVTSDTFELF
jgi:hypothetical protein